MRIRFPLALITGFLLLAPTVAPAQPAVPIIFDTDISGDVDDVLALAMLHTLADRQECELRAVTISKINPLTGPFTDAVNTFYGRPDIPIGVTRDAQRRQSRYLKLVNERTEDGEFRYPHDVTSNDELPSAVTLLRKTLAAADDQSIVIVQVGLGTNLADLLSSKPDEISRLSGEELVRRKVRLASVMAGAYVPIGDNDHFLEANVINGISAMQKLAAQWPDAAPIVWSGYEIGIATRYPRSSIHHDFRYREHHIAPEAYLLHSGPNHDRPSWDLTSVLYAVRPDENYFGLSNPGRVTIEKDGFSRFDSRQDGRDRYLKLTPVQAARVTEALRSLVSQPPKLSDN